MCDQNVSSISRWNTCRETTEQKPAQTYGKKDKHWSGVYGKSWSCSLPKQHPAKDLSPAEDKR